MYQENHRKSQITHLQHTMKCRFWRRAVLSTVGHVPTTILADCEVRDARGSAVATLRWVRRKGRNRLQNLEATSRTFSGPTSFQMFEKKWRNVCVQVPSIWNFGFFLEKIGSFKTALGFGSGCSEISGAKDSKAVLSC